MAVQFYVYDAIDTVSVCVCARALDVPSWELGAGCIKT